MDQAEVQPTGISMQENGDVVATAADGSQRKVKLRGWLFDTDKWGGDVWRTFHGATFKYPDNPDDDAKIRMRNRVLALPYELPCGSCSLNLVQELQELPLTADVLSNRNKLTHWAVELHNRVNKRLGKSVVSYEQVVNYFFFDIAFEPRQLHESQVQGGGTDSSLRPSAAASGAEAAKKADVMSLQEVVEFVAQPTSTAHVIFTVGLLLLCLVIIYWSHKRMSSI